MKKLSSEIALPKSERATADKERILEVLESFERDVQRMLKDPLYKALMAQYKTINKLTEELNRDESDEDYVNVSLKGDDKVFDRWLKYSKELEAIFKSFEYAGEESYMRFVINEEDDKKGGNLMTKRAKS